MPPEGPWHLAKRLMENKLKILFGKFNMREKALVVIIVWTVMLFWINGTIDSSGELSRIWKDTSDELGRQKSKLAEASRIKSEFDVRWAELDPNKTYSISQLDAKIDRIARELGLKFQTVTPKTKKDGLFLLHTVTITIKNATIEKLMAFDNAIKGTSPYIALQHVKITAYRTPPLLGATFHIRSFERQENADI